MSIVTLKLQKRLHLKSEKLEKFSFLLGGVILLFSAYNRYDSGRPNSHLFEIIYYAAYILGSILNIAAGMMYSLIPEDKKDFIGKWLQIIIAVLLLFDASDKIIKGKIAMPAALIFASLLYFMLAIFSSRLKGRRFISFDDEKFIYRKSLVGIKELYLKDIKDIHGLS